MSEKGLLIIILLLLSVSFSKEVGSTTPAARIHLHNEMEANCAVVSARQKTTLNNGQPLLALDGDISTCAEIGYDSEPWWMVQFISPCTLHSLAVHASAQSCSGELTLKVSLSNTTRPLGLQEIEAPFYTHYMATDYN